VFTCVGWQVTLCDPIWQATPCSSEMDFHYELINSFNFQRYNLGVIHCQQFCESCHHSVVLIHPLAATLNICSHPAE